HHTFFEMLGNFSFGDYFKKEAIHWAWEFLTEKDWLNLDPNRLTVTVYKDDDEAYNIWHEEVKLPTERIKREDEDENFWPASAPSLGPDGVCGPCSEIYYHPPNGGKEVEIWNLVFTQFNRVGDPPDNLRPLPKKNIDTGMGLERTASVLQGVKSNFEIDILKPLCLAAGDMVGVKYDFDSPSGRPLRRIADHVRAVTFCIHEGVVPDKQEENYVVRQLLRRALLEGFLLGQSDPFLYKLVPAVVEVMKSVYPEISETVDSVQGTIKEEESQFLGTIERGLERFEKCVEKAKSSKGSKISGEDAFTLHTQEGFLIELTEAMAAKRNLEVDRKKFQEMMEGHKTISTAEGYMDSVMAEGPLDAIRKTSGGTEFLGYDTTEADAEIVGIIAEKQLVEELTEVGHDSPVGVVLDQTPFYGESGGQVGDEGTISGEGFEFQVLDTQKEGELVLHIGHLKSGSLKLGAKVKAVVEFDRRGGIRRAHSATHLLHHALHKVVGEKATQRGSKVEDDRLRFDFAHNRALTKDEIEQVEDIINTRIAEGSPVTTAVMNIDEAKKLGAMALFGEKYGDRVRVVTMGNFSNEFCGGTHLTNTGQVGLCKIISEEPVAKGVRRIEALTGRQALQKIRDTEELLQELVGLLKTPQPQDLPRRVEILQNELRDAKRELAKQTLKSVSGQVDELIEGAEVVDGVRIITHIAKGATRETLRDFADQLRSKGGPAAILLGCEIEGKVALLAAVSKELIKKGVTANDCIKAAAKSVGGGGGGRPDLAEAGGKNPAGLPDAMKAATEFYRGKLQS
ncbi:MAG: alanine--tRNA ligase, partial [Planctomycetaceae bacterium]|nr:alanine--tRNA ligase [Planctomycetaceae bacterium]